MVGLYITEHGDVRVSPREIAILQFAADLRRYGDTNVPGCKQVLAKAAAIHAACERFARHSKGIV